MQSTKRASRPLLNAEDLGKRSFHESDRGFRKAGPSEPRQVHSTTVRVQQKDAAFLRECIEGLQPSHAKDPEVSAVHNIGVRIHRLAPHAKEAILVKLRELETAAGGAVDEAEETLNEAIAKALGSHRTAPSASCLSRVDDDLLPVKAKRDNPLPTWLAEARAVGLSSKDDSTLRSPQKITRRPTSGRRAVTPTPASPSVDPEYTETALASTSPRIPVDPPECDPIATHFWGGGDLEDSFDCLKKFRLSHLGRLGQSIDCSATLNDAPETAKDSPSPSQSPSPPTDQFCIPELPQGRHITVNVVSTWGDPHYVGLNGIEMYDEQGDPIIITNPHEQVKGSPESINVLPEYSHDPRTVHNLVDGVNRTRDDMHMWLAPFTAGADHLINIDLGRSTRLSMLRFWNYNKSRPHSSRGARGVEVALDGSFIFKGEIRQATGTLEGSEDHTEVILFTLDPNVLAKIDGYERKAKQEWEAADCLANEMVNSFSRPTTAHGARPTSSHIPDNRPSNSSLPQRPTTAVASVRRNSEEYPTGETIDLEIIAGWGDTAGCGMQGLEVLDAKEKPLPVAKIACNIPANVPVDTLLEPYVEGVQKELTWSVEHDMVSAPSNPITLTITLTAPTTISGISIWNYNTSLNATYKGVKRMRIYVDGALVSPQQGHYVRKAPGNCGFNFRHTLPLSTSPSSLAVSVHSSMMNKGMEDAMIRARALNRAFPRKVQSALGFEPPLYPVAYVFRIEIRSTHGDRHYVGLNGLEMRDVRDNVIPLRPENLQAVPRDITELEGMEDDCRTLDKLVDGTNATYDDTHMWLTPRTPERGNTLYVIFEEPQAVSLITFWNYSKTPSRGVNEVAVFGDDLLLYVGYLKPSPPRPEYHTLTTPDFGQHMLFTNDSEVCSRVADSLVSNTPGDPGSGVLFYDSGRVSDLDAMPPTSCGRRPGAPSVATLRLRPTTAAGYNG